MPVRKYSLTHEEDIHKFLYDEGPHSSVQIAEAFNLSKRRVGEILSHMSAGGRVGQINRGPNKYWILAEDLEENSKEVHYA